MHENHTLYYKTQHRNANWQRPHNNRLTTPADPDPPFENHCRERPEAQTSHCWFLGIVRPVVENRESVAERCSCSRSTAVCTFYSTYRDQRPFIVKSNWNQCRGCPGCGGLGLSVRCWGWVAVVEKIIVFFQLIIHCELWNCCWFLDAEPLS